MIASGQAKARNVHALVFWQERRSELSANSVPSSAALAVLHRRRCPGLPGWERASAR